MEHMKITHKDPNASGVASKYANLTSGPLGRSLITTSFLRSYIILHALTLQDRYTKIPIINFFCTCKESVRLAGHGFRYNFEKYFLIFIRNKLDHTFTVFY